MAKSPLFVGTANRVYAIDRDSGRVVWDIKLNDHFLKMGSSFVNLEFDGDSLFAATFGDLYCLNPQTGETRWKVTLQGTLANPVSFATSLSGNREAALAAKLEGERAG
jgi:outer membrane protein assembly factor BamB